MRPVHLEVEGNDGRPVPLTIQRPTHKILRQATRAGRRAYEQAVAGKLSDAPKAEDWPARAGAMWHSIQTDEEQLLDETRPLAERVAVALRLRESRLRYYAIVKMSPCDEAFFQARFEYIVARCVKSRLTGRAVFRSDDDYRRRATEPFSVRVAAAVAKALFHIDELAEEQFLREHPVAPIA